LETPEEIWPGSIFIPTSDVELSGPDGCSEADAPDLSDISDLP